MEIDKKKNRKKKNQRRLTRRKTEIDIKNIKNETIEEDIDEKVEKTPMIVIPLLKKLKNVESSEIETSFDGQERGND